MTAERQSTEVEVRPGQADGRPDRSRVLLVPDGYESVAIRCMGEHELRAFESLVHVPDAARLLATRHEGRLEDLQTVFLRGPRDRLDEALLGSVEVEREVHVRLGELPLEVHVHLGNAPGT